MIQEVDILLMFNFYVLDLSSCTSKIKTISGFEMKLLSVLKNSVSNFIRLIRKFKLILYPLHAILF